MDPITQQTALATAGAAGAGEGLYVDDVFSTYLYDGTGSAQTITNGIDLSGEGGMVWIKTRSHTDSHSLFDTERGATYYLKSDTSDNQYQANSALSAFNSDGFSLGGGDAPTNGSGRTLTSWTFRKAPGFFDVVTYTGTGTARTVAHSLGSVPGTIIVKRTNTASSWYVYHRSLGATKEIRLNTTSAANTSSIYWNDTEPTSSVFTVGTSAGVNGSGDTYVAYIFAHDDQSFGENGDESIIKCGTYTGNGSSQEIDLGFEPQWVTIKVSSGETGNWYQYDTMRGWTVNSENQNHLLLNTSDAEGDVSVSGLLNLSVTSTGFKLNNADHNKNLKEYVYMAIRRPHKPPEAGTDVFAVQATRAASDGTPDSLYFTSGFPVDLMLQLAKTSGTSNAITVDRVRGNFFSRTSQSAADIANEGYKLDTMEGVYADSSQSANSNFSGLLFKRAPGFFDIVGYEGTGSARTVSHNLGEVPELIIVKSRGIVDHWQVYSSVTDETDFLMLNQSDATSDQASKWNDTAPTSSVFTVNTDTGVNQSAEDYIAYLFATLPGISKVGSYTGTGSAINVDCGFTAGARFVLIKRTDSTGDWYVWDTARGIIAGDDPYVLFNTTGGEVTNTDYIDPLNAGFTITSTAPTGLNASGGTYLFLAIA